MKEFECPKCKTIVTYPDDKDMYAEMVAHIEKCSIAAQPSKTKNIADVLPKEVLNGNIIGMDECLGLPLMVMGMTWRESTFKEETRYLALEIMMDGEKKILNTGAERIIEAFTYVKPEELPLEVIFGKVTTKAGRRVYRIVKPEENVAK